MNTDDDDKPPVPSTTVDYCRTISQDLRHLDDGLTHAIDQLTTFNSETMSDLSLKYEYIRNNESRVIGFFARQLLLLQKHKINHHNGGFHNEYIKLDRFLSVLNLNKKSIQYLVKRMTFDDLLNGKAIAREKLLYDAETSEIERRDFRNALNALKDCINYFSHGGTNDNGRFSWHTETPPPAHATPYSVRQHRLSDTALSVPVSTDSTRSISVTSSLSTEFATGNSTNSNHSSAGMIPLPQGRRSNLSHTPPPSRSNHLCVNGKRKCEHPSKKSTIDPSIFLQSSNVNSSRNNNDSQLYDGETTPRRGSCGSDSEPRVPSGAATPKSPTFSCSPLNSAYNSDTENDPKTPESILYNTQSPILTQRMTHKIQHRWSNLMKLSTCNVCAKKIFFLGTKCNACKYKCHKECVQNAPENCGLSEKDLRNMINNVEIQHAFINSSPLTRKTLYTPSESTSPTSLTPMSAPDSPSPHPSLSGYHFNPSAINGNSSVNVTESVYCTQNDADSWVVIETNSKTTSENSEPPFESDANRSINPSETSLNTHRLMRQLSESEPAHPDRESFQATLSISFDDELDQTRTNDWVISYDTIKLVEEVKRSSGTLMKAHWHGEMAVRKIKPDPKMNDGEFLNELKKHVFRLRKVRHEHLNLYTGVCIESPNYAIASNWIRGFTLYEMIHIRNDSILPNLAVQYATQIARAMSYLHEKSINHMSLRTTNIFIQNNRVILTDYGLIPLTKCYHYNDQPALIAPRGWLSYLAPEIIRKLDPRDEQTILQHTPQTDVYAFGTVWYELLFREFPFAKQPPEYIIWRAGNSLKQPLSSVHIRKNAKDIIHQCWSFVPDDRPDFAMLCKSFTKMPSKPTLVRSPSTPLQYHGNPLANNHFN